MAINFLFLILIFILPVGYGCELKHELVSLSGPVTMLLEELDLLGDKKLKAISIYHPIKDKTSAKILAGGIFLSKKSLKNDFDSYVVFDKSQELKESLIKVKTKKLIEFDSYGIDSFSVTKNSLIIVKDLTHNCETKIKKLTEKISNLEKSLKESWKHKNLIFFLGKISKKLPELIMVEDGFVLFLKKNNLIDTYPSSLAYVNWSQKELSKLKGYYLIGLVDGREENIKINKVVEKSFNLSYRGLFIPGIRQVYFLNQLSKINLN